LSLPVPGRARSGQAPIQPNPTAVLACCIAAALSDEDEISLHLQDTLNAGDGLVDPRRLRVLVEEGRNSLKTHPLFT